MVMCMYLIVTKTAFNKISMCVYGNVIPDWLFVNSNSDFQGRYIINLTKYSKSSNEWQIGTYTRLVHFQFDVFFSSLEFGQ